MTRLIDIDDHARLPWRFHGQRLRIMHFDYVYSSTCPCSLELSEHARETRSRLATPHSQRSIARISAVMG